MIINKSMLAGALAVCRPDKEFPMFNYVFIEKDGTIVAANKMVVYIAQPVLKQIIHSIPFGDKTELPTTIILSAESVEKIVKAVQVDKLFKGILENVSLSLNGDNVKVEINSGKQSQFLTVKNAQQKPIDWRKFVRTVYNERHGAEKWVFNRSRLTSAVDVLDDACRYDGKFSPVFCEVSGENKILWRSINEMTGQRVWLVFDHTSIKEKWPELNEWENSFILQNEKVTGDNLIASFLDRHCKCGCRLRTDKKLIWCSSPSCNYHAKALIIKKAK